MRPLTACAICGGNELAPFSMDPYDKGRLHFAQARCRGCGLVAAQPQASEEEMNAFYTSRYYEEHALDPETHWRENVRDYPRYELPLMQRLWDGFGPPPGGSVAEVGCGHGSLLSVLGDRGYRARGCELSPAAAAFCRSKGLDVTDGADFGEDTARGSFDAAVSLQVIEHVADPRAFVRRLVALARPGGAVVIATENVWTSYYAVARAKAWLRRELPPFRTVSEHTFVFQGHHLERLLAEEGCDRARSAAYARTPQTGSLHFRLIKNGFRAADRLLGMGEYLMAVGRRKIG